MSLGMSVNGLWICLACGEGISPAEPQPLPGAVHQGTVRRCRPARGEQKGVLQFLLGFVSALVLPTEGGWEWVRSVKKEMPSPSCHSPDSGGDAALELFEKLKRAGWRVCTKQNAQGKICN